MRVTQEYYNRIIVVEYIKLFLATFGVALAIVLNEVKLEGKMTELQENLFLSYIAFTTLALLVAVYYRY